MDLMNDPRLIEYNLPDAGFTALVTGPTGSGKTLAIRRLIENLGREEVLVIATDPRLAPLDGLRAKVFRAWIEPGMEGSELKAAATDAWNRLNGFLRDLIMATKSGGKDHVPKVVVLDSLSNLGDILGYKLAPVGGQLSQPQWGQLAAEVMKVVTVIRGLQSGGMLRIINCTSGWDTDDQGRKVPVMFIGMGGKLAPRHTPRFVDFQFHIESYLGNIGDPMAGPDGMVRRFHTCEHDGIMAKGHPKLPTPVMKADWWEVWQLIYGGTP